MRLPGSTALRKKRPVPTRPSVRAWKVRSKFSSSRSVRSQLSRGCGTPLLTRAPSSTVQEAAASPPQPVRSRPLKSGPSMVGGRAAAGAVVVAFGESGSFSSTMSL